MPQRRLLRLFLGVQVFFLAALFGYPYVPSWVVAVYLALLFRLGTCLGYIVLQSEMVFSVEEFQTLLAAGLVFLQFDKWWGRPTINYGVGMACSYFEGYLKLVIPSNGTPAAVGLEGNISAYEASQGVVFPVRKLLVIITKSLNCPPNLEHYNSNDPDAAYIEVLSPLNDVERDVAGVRNRSYRNAVYKIYRPNALPVCISAEFATPMRTLYHTLQDRNLYGELCDADKEELKRDFCRQLERMIKQTPDTRGRCHLVHFDDTVENASLADVLLAKIAELEPNFEDILRRHAAMYALRRPPAP